MIFVRVRNKSLFHEVARPSVIVLFFPRKSDDDIRRDRHFFTRFANPLDERAILGGGVRPMHRFQDPVGTGLERQMNVLGELR